MKKKKSNKAKYLFGLLGLIFLGVGSLALFSLFNQGAMDLLAIFGITNFYIQMLVVIFVVLAGLLFSGITIWKAFGKIAKGQ